MIIDVWLANRQRWGMDDVINSITHLTYLFHGKPMHACYLLIVALLLM